MYLSHEDKTNLIIKLLLNEEHKSLRIDDAIKIFINHSKIVNRDDTTKFYIKNLNYFFDFIYLKYPKINDISQLNKDMLDNYIISCKNRSNKNTTINKRIITLKTMFNYLYDQELIDIHPYLKIKKLVETSPETITIEINDIIKIINYLKNENLNKIINLRNYLITLLLFDTGMRVNELVHVKIKNIDLNKNTIFLDFTKTKKLRKVFFSNETKKVLENYLSRTQINNYEYLLQTRTKTVPTTKTITMLYEDIRQTLGIKYSISPHKWRHTLASNLLKNGANIRSVQLILGHTTLNTTQKYLHLNDESLKNDFSRCQVKY